MNERPAIIEIDPRTRAVPGDRVTVRGQDGVVVETKPGVPGRYGRFDPRRELQVKFGSRVKSVRRSDVEISP